MWSDFQAAPPRGGPEAARTGYGLYYAWKCRGKSGRGAFEFRAIAGFHPRGSWVKAEVLRDSAESRRVLGHERTHFNITEVHARRMRRHFAALVEPCGRTDSELSAEARRLLEEEKATQRRYDEETDHGLRTTQQARWEAEVRRDLTPP